MKKVLGALLLLAVLASTALAAPRTVTLVLLRHGESEWNLEKKKSRKLWITLLA